MKIYIFRALFTLSFSILILNSQCKESQVYHRRTGIIPVLLLDTTKTFNQEFIIWNWLALKQNISGRLIQIKVIHAGYTKHHNWPGRMFAHKILGNKGRIRDVTKMIRLWCWKLLYPNYSERSDITSLKSYSAFSTTD